MMRAPLVLAVVFVLVLGYGFYSTISKNLDVAPWAPGGRQGRLHFHSKNVTRFAGAADDVGRSVHRAVFLDEDGFERPADWREVLRRVVTPDGRARHVVVLPAEGDDAERWALPGGYWAAYAKAPVVFAGRDGLAGDAIGDVGSGRTIYVLAPERLIPDAALEELRARGTVVRVAGGDLAAHAVRIAEYRDEGTGFGWGRTRERRTGYFEFVVATPSESAAAWAALPLAQSVCAASREENAVGAIILTRQDAREAFTAMQRVTHMPVNAPLLYLDGEGRLSDRTKREMRRLHPDGVVQDGKTQVYIVGAADPSVADEVRRELKYSVRELRSSTPIELAELLDRWQAALKSDHPDEVVLTAIDHPDGIAHGMGAMGWNAHMGKGFAWVYRDRIPDATRRILARRHGAAYMYLTGPPGVISDEVAAELGRYGLVRRIAGPDAIASNVVNAGYKDFGRNFGWLFGHVPRGFGWGIAQSGHNFIFGNADMPLHVIPAVVLGHMGKHGPLLLVRRDDVPERVKSYLEMVRPERTPPTETIVNHGWVIGSDAALSWNVQKELTRLLAPRGAMGEVSDESVGTGTAGTSGR